MKFCKDLKFLTKVKIVLSLVLMAAVIMGITGVALAEDGGEEVVLYDAAEFSEFEEHTKEDAVEKYIQAIYKGKSFQDGKEESYYKKAPGLKGDDDPGEISEDTMDSMMALVNYYRYLAGLSPVASKANDYYSKQVQEEALAYANSKRAPSDPSLKIWSFGYTPLKSVTNWMYENYSYGDEAFRSRRKIIDPEISNIYLGYSKKGAVYYETEAENTTNLPFVAYPGQGFMPKELIQRFDDEVWMIKLDEEKIRYADASGVSVIITDPDNKSYTLTKAAGTLMFYDQWLGFSLSKCSEGTGSWPLGTYKVEVTGLTDVATDKSAKICYSTTFFDVTDALSTKVTGCSINGAKKLVLPASMTTETNLDAVAGILPKEITVTAANGRVLKIPAKASWVVDKANKCFKNSALEGWLPSEVEDETQMLDSVCIAYETAETPNAISLNFRNSSLSDQSLPQNSNIAYHGCAFTVTKPAAGDMKNCIIYYSKAGTSPYTVYRDSRIDYSSQKLEKKDDGSFEVSTYFASEDDSGSLLAVCFTDGEETAYISDAIYITVLPRDTSTSPTNPTNPTNPNNPTNPTSPTNPTPGSNQNGDKNDSDKDNKNPSQGGEQNPSSQDTGNNSSEDTDSAPADKGSKLTDTNAKCYVKVISDDKTDPQVAYVGTSDKKATKVTVPDKVTIGGVTYQVTSISNKAFSGNKKLKKIVIKSTKIKSVGKNAFKGTNKKLVIKVPKNKFKEYKKLFKNKGNKNVKVIK